MFFAKVDYIKMSVGVIAYSQLMLVCQVNISTFFWVAMEKHLGFKHLLNFANFLWCCLKVVASFFGELFTLYFISFFLCRLNIFVSCLNPLRSLASRNIYLGRDCLILNCIIRSLSKKTKF